MKTFSPFSIINLVLMSVLIGYSSPALALEKKLVVSVEAENTSFIDLLEEIANQTQWSMVVDVRLADKAVSGSFQEIEIDSFLKRSLKGENIIVLYDEENKSVDIRSFGGAQAIVTISADPFANKEDKKKIEALWQADQKAYDEYLANPNSVEPLTGIPLSEIAALHEAENKAYQEYHDDPDSVEPLTGVKLSSIKKLHAEEEKAYQEYLANPESVEPLTGMKLSYIKAMHTAEQKAYEEYKAKSLSINSVPE